MMQQIATSPADNIARFGAAFGADPALGDRLRAAHAEGRMEETLIELGEAFDLPVANLLRIAHGAAIEMDELSLDDLDAVTGGSGTDNCSVVLGFVTQTMNVFGALGIPQFFPFTSDNVQAISNNCQ